MMLELKLGFVSNQELADWGQITIGTLNKRKKIWCEKTLSKYADYELIRGGVNILNIKESIYQGTKFKEVKKKYKKYWGTKDFPVDSTKNVWKKLEPHLVNDIKKETGLGYINKARRDEFGPIWKKLQRHGELGTCHYVFCKIVDGEAKSFTDQEQEIKLKLLKKYLRTDEQIIMDIKALNRAYLDKEIAQKEYEEALEEITNIDMGWNAFVSAFEEETGCRTGCRIKIERDWPEDNFAW